MVGAPFTPGATTQPTFKVEPTRNVEMSFVPSAHLMTINGLAFKNISNVDAMTKFVATPGKAKNPEGKMKGFFWQCKVHW